jgi:iron complex outermembrane recepter protein
MRKIHLIGTSLLAVTIAHPAYAQVAPQAAESGATEPDEIIVTAAGRAQVAQDVPIALSVVGGEALVNAGISDIRGIRQLAVSLQTTTGQSAATGAVLRIRGIGTAGDNPGFEPAVGVFIDGVFRARSGIALSDLPPLDRVEVLRGPQGTLFGRNTSAGALNLITQRPAFDLGGYVEGSYGNYNEIELKAGVTGPVSERVALRLDGSYHKRDGYIIDVNTPGRRINNVDRYFVRGQAIFESETVKFRLIGDYAETNEQCCGALSTNSGFTGIQNPATAAAFGAAFVASSVVQGVSAAAGRIGIVTPFNPSARRQAISPNRDYREAVNEWGLSGQFDLALNDSLNLTSITAYRDWKVLRNQDIDFSGIDRAYRDGYRNGLKDFTQEIRLQGTAFDEHLDWLVGGFYLNEKLALKDTVRFGTQADAYVDNFISGLTRSVTLPTGFQVFGTKAATPLVGQVLLASNPALAAAAGAGGPAVLATFLNPFPATPAGAGQIADNYNVTTNAIAIFTHNIIKFDDNLSLTVGLRYNHETKKIAANLNSANPSCNFLAAPQAALLRAGLAGLPSGLGSAIINLTCNPTVNTEFNGIYNGQKSENELTGTAKLAYKVTNRILVYGGYDHGYKAGGYNLDRATFDSVLLGGNGAQISDLAFKPETVDSYEVGIKTDITREFTLNASAFTADFKNFQDLTFIGNNFRVTSVAKVRSRGIELESIIRPARNLVVNLGYAYIQATYLDNNLPVELRQNNGVQVTNQPRNTVSTSMTWTPQLNDSVGALLHVDARFNSKANTVNDALAVPFTANQAYAIVNARIGLNFLDNKLSVEAYVENLFDTYYNITAFPVPEQSSSFAVYPSTPRFYGIKARVQF